MDDSGPKATPGGPPAGLGPRTVGDEDMLPSDMTIDFKVISFLHLYSDFCYNSLGSICTCHYFLIATNVYQSASPSKVNFQFDDNLTILNWEGYNSFIRSAIEVNDHLMEILFHNLSNRSGSISISH